MRKLYFCMSIIFFIGCDKKIEENKEIVIPKYDIEKVETNKIVSEMTDRPLSIISITPSEVTFNKYGDFSYPELVVRCEHVEGNWFTTNYYLLTDEFIAYDGGRSIFYRIDKLKAQYSEVDEVSNNFYRIRNFKWHTFNEPIKSGRQLKIQYSGYDRQVNLTYNLYKLRLEMRKFKNECNWD